MNLSEWYQYTSARKIRCSTTRETCAKRKQSRYRCAGGLCSSYCPIAFREGGVQEFRLTLKFIDLRIYKQECYHSPRIEHSLSIGCCQGIKFPSNHEGQRKYLQNELLLVYKLYVYKSVSLSNLFWMWDEYMVDGYSCSPVCDLARSCICISSSSVSKLPSRGCSEVRSN